MVNSLSTHGELSQYSTFSAVIANQYHHWGVSSVGKKRRVLEYSKYTSHFMSFN